MDILTTYTAWAILLLMSFFIVVTMIMDSPAKILRESRTIEDEED